MAIEQRQLGRTGLTVSLMGVGGGGNSRLGLSAGLAESHAVDVIRAALDMGITMIDTARVYGTEGAVGQALRGRREGVTISSKSPYLDEDRQLLSAEAFARNLDESLRALGVERIDLYFIHGLLDEYYAASRDRFIPVLEQARAAGKIGWIGVTEAFERDTGHTMLQTALQEDLWDVVMVGFNLLNPSARERVLAVTQQKGIGTLGMFAVRRGLIRPELLRVLLRRLAREGAIEPGLADAEDLPAALGLAEIGESLTGAAYRFAAFAPGLDCVLSGTSSAAHLRENLAAAARGPLPARTLERLQALFGRVDSLSGQVGDEWIDA